MYEVPADDRVETMTLEAFADTIIPGEKRWPDDRAVAGASPGPGAVAAGALDLLRMPATGVSAGLRPLSESLNEHATLYASAGDLDLDADVPAFVALPFADRTALVATLVAPGHPEKDGWVSLALFCNMAFDSAAHLHTADALAEKHPGLHAMGFTQPDATRLWRFAKHSYGRKLADVHHDTTASGSLG